MGASSHTVTDKVTFARLISRGRVRFRLRNRLYYRIVRNSLRTIISTIEKGANSAESERILLESTNNNISRSHNKNTNEGQKQKAKAQVKELFFFKMPVTQLPENFKSPFPEIPFRLGYSVCIKFYVILIFSDNRKNLAIC